MIVRRSNAVAFDDGDEYADQRGWWTCCPVCGKSGLLTAHTVTHPFDEAKGHPVPNIDPSCRCQCGAHWLLRLGEVVIL